MRKHRIIRWILIAAGIALLCYAATLVRLCVLEKRQGGARGDEDAIIVLGAQVRADGTPSVQLQWRLDTAYELWQKHPVPIVTCGAQGSDEPAPEGDVMRQILTDLGVPEEMILVDRTSFNTWANLSHAKALLGEDVRSVVIVTSEYHLPRAMDMAAQMGFDAGGIGSPTLPEYWIKNHFRETLSWWKYWGQKYLGLFGGLAE